MTLRRKPPLRTFKKTLVHYSSYRRYLESDFNNRCGYCDIGEKKLVRYHIDHFAPLKHFSTLHNDYNNLVYACQSCNLSKSDKWPMLIHSATPTPHNNGTIGFIDPCDPAYEHHLGRASDGLIFGKTELGKQIISELNLNLPSHQTLWIIEKLNLLYLELTNLIATLNPKDPQVVVLQNKINLISVQFMKYYNL